MTIGAFPEYWSKNSAHSSRIITDRETTSNDLIDLLCMYINTSKKFEKKEDVKALCELGRKVEILTKKINYIQQKYKESVTSNIRTSEELAKVKQKETDKTCKIKKNKKDLQAF